MDDIKDKQEEAIRNIAAQKKMSQAFELLEALYGFHKYCKDRMCQSEGPACKNCLLSNSLGFCLFTENARTRGADPGSWNMNLFKVVIIEKAKYLGDELTNMGERKWLNRNTRG